MNEAIKKASFAQNAAADPRYSTFVSANAGSGKTTILTNRIARLLYHGVKPNHILCVTFTKAAAGEVQNRIFDRLGRWVLMDKDDLRAELEEIGERDVGDENLRHARRLFAEALETPGGLKIQTIHAFAASILRRFPLEAAVSPGFREIGDAEAKNLAIAAMNKAILDAPESYLKLSQDWRFTSDLAEQMVKYGAGFKADMGAEEFAQALGFGKLQTPQALIESFEAGMNADEISQIAAKLTNRYNRKAWENYLTAREGEDAEAGLQAVFNFLYKQDGDIRANIPAPETKDADTADIAMRQFVGRAFDALDHYRAGLFCEKLAAFHPFAAKVYSRYQAVKSARSVLDYDDLIARAEALLNQNDRINWVMYRLDGGIEHVLVDEAQDTNDAQWRIIDAIAKGFGEDQSRDRTLFVVGDEKQSIFAFQGANPDIFAAKRNDYSAYLKTRGEDLKEQSLLMSFRSSPLVLDFVDTLFKSELARGLGGNIRHQAKAEDIPGAIEIWPFRFFEKAKSKSNWPIINIEAKESEELTLARDIADMICRDIKDGRQIVDDGKLRPVRPGDYLILLRKRKLFFYAVQKALRENGVPIAGVDSLKLNEELAVKDIMALLRVAAAPFDDLSLACFLRSPLGGLSEAELFELAHDRGDESLLDRLAAQKERFRDAWAQVEYARRSSDYERPHDLISEILTGFGGERKLRARLGVSVEDILSSLLDTALQYELEETPSLAGFIAWFDRQKIDIKRTLIDDGSALRVMTIHGAKGLEAPIVILPMIDGRDGNEDRFAMIDALALPSSKTAKPLPPPEAIIDRLARAKEKRKEEDNRLLYVALTRARSKLVICGIGETVKKGADARGFKKGHIYPKLLDALNQSGAVENDEGVLCKFLNWPDERKQSDADEKKKPVTKLAQLPKIKPIKKVKSVSELLDEYDGEASGRGPVYGELLHHYCEMLPQINQKYWDRIAQNLKMEGVDHLAAYKEAKAVFEHFPKLLETHWLRECDFELDLGAYRLRGRIDAVEIGERICVVDYKSNIEIADNSQKLSKNYHNQLAIYAEAMRRIYPDREVLAEIIWTYRPRRLVVNNDELARNYQKFIAGIAP